MALIRRPLKVVFDLHEVWNLCVGCLIVCCEIGLTCKDSKILVNLAEVNELFS